MLHASSHHDAVTFQGKMIVKGHAEGVVLASTMGLSFWGGVHPQTGVVVDHHHPLQGSSLHGKILVIPSSRGSCSGSGLLLELILNGHSPAAIVFEYDEFILTLGVIIAHEVFGKSIPVVQLSTPEFEAFSKAPWGRIDGSRMEAMPTPFLGTPKEVEIALDAPSLEIPSGINLTAFDYEVLEGGLGKAAQVAGRVILRMAAIQGATELIDVTQAHIDGCVYTGPSTLRFAQQFVDWGAKVRIPSSLNSISVDKRLWKAQGVDPAVGEAASLLADAYVKMGALPTYTCAPYQLDTAPKKGDQIVWSESNAVVYANSVLGARTMKCPDFMDICVALTSRAPNAGCHITSNRRAQLKIVLPTVTNADDSLFPLLGHVVGDIAANCIPIVAGLENTVVTNDDLKAFGAAFATTASAAMFHIAGITPEASTLEDIALQFSVATTVTVTYADLIQTWRTLNGGVDTDTKVDLISLGNPHFSYEEFVHLANLCDGRIKSGAVSVMITSSRDIYAKAYRAGIITALEKFGVQHITDTCWCMIVEPLIPLDAHTIMTNSAKYAHYGGGLTGRHMRFGSLAQCLDAACTGRASYDIPEWLDARSCYYRKSS